MSQPKDYTGPRSYYEFLQTVQLQGEHGNAFGYKTVNTDVLGWIIARATVRYASHPVASNSANDPVTLPAFDALAAFLSKLP